MYKIKAYLKQVLSYWKSAVWFMVILYSLFSPSDKMPHSRLFDIEHLDKLVHMGLFAIFSLLLYYDLKKEISLTNLKKKIIIIIITTITAVMTELVQSYFLLSRTGDIIDLFADILGIPFGITVALLIDSSKSRFFPRKL